MFIYLFFFLFQRRISELPGPIGVKLGDMVGSRL